MGLFSRLFTSPTPPPTRPQAARPAPRPTEQRAELVEFFTTDHRACDASWAEVEAAQGPAALEAFRRFDTAMRRHLRWEEEVIFPAFEEVTGHQGFGPTWIMRGEHEQMRALLDEMGRCAGHGDVQGILDQGDTLLMLIQQHNAKEEGMLYPLSNEVLGDQWEALKARLTG